MTLVPKETAKSPPPDTEIRMFKLAARLCILCVWQKLSLPNNSLNPNITSLMKIVLVHSKSTAKADFLVHAKVL